MTTSVSEVGQQALVNKGPLELAKSAKGKFLCARVAFEPGSVVMRFGIAALLTRPDRYSYQTGIYRHMLPDPEFLWFVNHSCVPNVFVDTNEMCLLAINRIDPGDEIVFFYPSTEWSMHEPFLCHCGSPQCLGRIQGAAYIADGILSKYHLADHIKMLLRQRADALAQE